MRNYDLENQLQEERGGHSSFNLKDLKGKGAFIPSPCSDGVAIFRWIRGTATVAGCSAI